MAEEILFFGFAGLALVTGLIVIAARNPVHSAMALIANLLALAALFAMLDAHFLAAMQVLVYAGAILVLFLFVIMLLNLKPAELRLPMTHLPVGKTVAVLILAIAGGMLLWRAGPLGTGAGFEPVDPAYGTLETVGAYIFGPHVLPFEAVSILLLAAILGAVTIAKKRIW